LQIFFYFIIIEKNNKQLQIAREDIDE
jgi:hypothetical protein